MTDEAVENHTIIPPKRAAATDEGDRAQGVPTFDDPADDKVRGSRRKDLEQGEPEEKPKAKKPAAKKKPAKKS